jgi:hypothetical protein
MGESLKFSEFSDHREQLGEIIRAHRTDPEGII